MLLFQGSRVPSFGRGTTTARVYKRLLLNSYTQGVAAFLIPNGEQSCAIKNSKRQKRRVSLWKFLRCCLAALDDIRELLPIFLHSYQITYSKVIHIFAFMV